MSTDAVIRDATVADLAAICEIYAHAVHETTATMDTEPWDPSRRVAWLEDHARPRHCVRVVEAPDVGIVGWGKLAAWSPKAGYATTVEVSVFVRPDRFRRGIGRALLGDLIDVARGAGHHVVIGRIEASNAASLRLFASGGFVEAGVLREVGRKFDRWLDVVVVQRTLGD